MNQLQREKEEKMAKDCGKYSSWNVHFRHRHLQTRSGTTIVYTVNMFVSVTIIISFFFLLDGFFGWICVCLTSYNNSRSQKKKKIGCQFGRLFCTVWLSQCCLQRKIQKRNGIFLISSPFFSWNKEHLKNDCNCRPHRQWFHSSSFACKQQRST